MAGPQGADYTVLTTMPRSAIGLVLLFAAGCGSDALSSPTADRLRKLGDLYLEYVLSHNGQGPANEQVFKKFVNGLPGHRVETSGVDETSRDALYVSERDGQPFVIRYGVVIREVGGTEAPLIAYEQTGQKGKRLVVFANAKAEEVDEGRLEQLTSAKP